MSFTTPVRTGKARREPPAISVGVRRRGKYKKLTPYVLFTKDAAVALFGTDTGVPLSLAIGSADHEGWIRLTRDPEAGNVNLRIQSKDKGEMVVETVLIPFNGSSPVRRCEPEVDIQGQYIFVRPPWANKPKQKNTKKEQVL